MGTGTVSPPDRGGGGGQDHQPGRDAAVAGAQPCPVLLPTPSLRVWPRWGAGTRRGDTLVAEGTPPGRAKQAGAGGTRSMLGAREGHVPAWRRWETQGCGGTSPVMGGGRGRGGHPHGHPNPSPTPPGLCPLPAAAPGSPVLTWGSPQRCSPCLCHFSSQGLWGLLFSPCRGLGARMKPEGQDGVQGPSLAQGLRGQDGLQGPPLAQPLMSPVREAG